MELRAGYCSKGRLLGGGAVTNCLAYSGMEIITPAKIFKVEAPGLHHHRLLSLEKKEKILLFFFFCPRADATKLFGPVIYALAQ